MVLSSASSLRGSPAAPLRPFPRGGIHSTVLHLNSRASASPRKRRQRASAVFDLRNDADPPSPSSSTPPPLPRSLPRSLSFRVAAPGADLRAAASLRALAFSTNLQPGASASAAEAPSSSSSSGPSLFAREAYIRTRSREAWDALEARAKGADEDYAGCGCLCLLGTIEDCRAVVSDDGEEDAEDEALARAVRAEGDASCTLAAVAADLLGDQGEKRRRLAVASLDIIVGPRLPSEALVAAGSAPTAYLANVSVAPAARRRGLGVALLSEAISLVAAGAVPSGNLPSPPARVAVHAEARNAAARALYEHRSLGFELEQEESLQVESLRGRPRRVLYSRPVVL